MNEFPDPNIDKKLESLLDSAAVDDTEFTEIDLAVAEQDIMITHGLLLGLQNVGFVMPANMYSHIELGTVPDLDTLEQGDIDEIGWDYRFYCALADIKVATAMSIYGAGTQDTPDEYALNCRNRGVGYILGNPESVTSWEQKDIFLSFVNDFLGAYMLPVILSSNEAKNQFFAAEVIVEAEEEYERTTIAVLNANLRQALTIELGHHDDINNLATSIRLISANALAILRTSPTTEFDHELMQSIIQQLQTIGQPDFPINLTTEGQTGSSKLVEFSYGYAKARLEGNSELDYS